MANIISPHYHTIEEDENGVLWDVIVEHDEEDDEDAIYLDENTPVEEYQDYVTWN